MTLLDRIRARPDFDATLVHPNEWTEFDALVDAGTITRLQSGPIRLLQRADGLTPSAFALLRRRSFEQR